MICSLKERDYLQINQGLYYTRWFNKIILLIDSLIMAFVFTFIKVSLVSVHCNFYSEPNF